MINQPFGPNVTSKCPGTEDDKPRSESAMATKHASVIFDQRAGTGARAHHPSFEEAVSRGAGDRTLQALSVNSGRRSRRASPDAERTRQS